MSILRYHRPAARAALLQGRLVPWIERHKRKDYIKRCVLSFPPWVDIKAIKKLWHLARIREWQTGVPHSLDHIVPLSHPLVCGLSVPWNMRVMPTRENLSKGNGWHPDMPHQGDLFHE